MPTCNVREKTLSHILVHVFCLYFLRMHQDYFLWRSYESVREQFLSGNINAKWKVVLLVIYLFNYDSSKSAFFMLNMDGIWRSLEYTFYQINWNSFLAIIQRLQEHPSHYSVFWYVLFYKKVIVLHHGEMIFYFDICIRFPLSTIFSTMKKW